MELKAKSGEVKELVTSISDVSGEASATVNEDGIKIISIDPAAAIRVVLSIEKDFFDTYDVDDEEELEIDVDTLKQALGKMNKDDELTITLDDSDSKMKLTAGGSTFRLKLIENLDLTEVDVEKLEEGFVTEGTVDIGAFGRAISSATMFDSSVDICAEDGVMNIEAEGSMGSTEQAVNFDGSSDDAESTFADDYLKKLISSGKRISDTMTVKMGEDYPMRADFNGDNVSAIYLLAPRVTED